MTIIRPFARLPNEVQKVVKEAGTKTRLSVGKVLFCQDEPGDCMYLIESGTVRLFFRDRVETKVLGPGQYLGEISLLAPGVNRTATAIIDSNAELRVLSQQTVDKLRTERPEVLCTLLQETCAYLVASERDLTADVRKRNRELERTLDFLRRTQEELEESEILAQTDELTTLYNLRCLNEQLPKFLDRVERAGGELAVLMVDVDHLKVINDRHGHAAGDLVLKNVAQLLVNRTRRTDLPCRIGGDEFAVVFSNTEEDAARDRAEEVRKAVPELEIQTAGATLDVTVSVGGAMYQPGDAPGQLMKRADASLYLAKKSGRNRLGWMGKVD